MLKILLTYDLGGHSSISFGNSAIAVGTFIFLKFLGKDRPPSFLLPKYIQAEVLKGTELFIKRKSLPNTDDGEYYHADLLALNVYEPDGKKMGVVKAMHNFGAGDIVEVAIGETEKTVLIPFNSNTVTDIDFVKQKMIVEIPLGLLD